MFTTDSTSDRPTQPNLTQRITPSYVSHGRKGAGVMKVFAFVPEVFPIDGAAHYLGVSKSTVEEWISRGLIHTYRLPSPQTEGEYLKRTLIRKGELDRFIESGVTI